MVHSMICSQGVVVPARQSTWLAGRYNNPMPELILSPSQGSMNSATEAVRHEREISNAGR